ncbi:hypothetical protein EG68_07704 [Paragonimus skrjabini miyazakii]|uniref:Ubiquitin carboxyl-terminal hydrolase n=1 Tax=Paragonimus skrjabini miyazakii TaxID=59628 RepID=A0A8S9YPN4_9TREM|nr:hypothetical protein EG68_07704 [Paragonimus skrjabini miyazakii]
MSDSGNWCLIESDPGVFTELMKGFGAEGLECDEIYDLKETNRISDALGLVFLFKWDGVSGDDEKIVHNPKSKGLFFAKQVINNACATQAIINILLNLDDSEINLGETLTQFKSFVVDFDSSMKGTALSNSDKIRAVHNSFSNYQVFEFEDKASKKENDTYHFVGYIPVKGTLYELDGLKEGPVDHGIIPDNCSWVDYARPILEKRMQKCVDGNFNLMAVVPNRLNMYEKQLTQLRNTAGNKSAELIEELEKNIANEKQKAASCRQENIRRRHNYLPLIIELLKILAEDSCLLESVNKAKTIGLERHKAKTISAKK